MQIDKFKINSPFWRFFVIDMWPILRQHDDSIVQKQQNLFRQQQTTTDNKKEHKTLYRIP